ncbi:putative ribonuclease H-like domain-containing protein [Tanacetum coccineum]
MADKGTEFADSRLHSIGNITLESLNQAANESPFDTESEIRIVKRFKPATNEEVFTSKESDAAEDSKLESIPDDEIGSPLAFLTSINEETLSEPILSKSEEKDTDNVLEELAGVNASTNKPSESISHIKEEIISLFTKIGQMESNITNKVTEEVKSSMPVFITEDLKQELTGLLTDALKSTLPALLKDLIKESVDTCVEEKLPIFKEEVQNSFKAQIPKLFTIGIKRSTSEQGFLNDVYEEKTHEDLHTCLFACFLSQEEQKRVIKALIARIEAIRLFLGYASFMGFIVYQMDVKSAFLYGTIEEEVYVCQSLGFEDLDYPDKVYKVVKALYGLHQAPRAWYETLANYLLGNGFQKGKIDQTLFIKKQKGDILLVQIYVDDIIFGSTNKELYVKTASTPVDLEKPLVKDGDADDVDLHLYRSMIGSLMFLTGTRPDIIYLKGKSILGLLYSRDSSFELVAYTNSNYVGATQDRKSTTRGCQFLGNRLISWQCKKQTVIAPLQLKLNMWLLLAVMDKYSGFKINCWIIGQDTKVPQSGGPPKKEESTCLPHATIFIELARMGYEKPSQSAKTTAWNEFSSTMESAIKYLANKQKFNFSRQVEGKGKHTETYAVSSYTKNIFSNIRRQSHGFSRDVAPLFDTMMVQASEEMGEDSDLPVDFIQIPIVDQPSTSFTPKKKHKSKRRQRKEAKENVLDLQKEKDDQAKEIATLKKIVKKLERKKRGKIEDLDADNEVTIIDDTQREDDADMMFDTLVLKDNDVIAEHIKEPEEVTTVSGLTTTTIDELTLAQTLIEIVANSKKVEDVTTVATSVTTAAVSRPKAKGIVFHDHEQTHLPTISSQEPTLKSKDKDMERSKKDITNKEQERSSKRVSDDLETSVPKKQKIGEHVETKKNVEVKVDDSAELKNCLEIVLEDEDDVIVDATPFSSRLPSIVDYKIHKERKKKYFHIIRADDDAASLRVTTADKVTTTEKIMLTEKIKDISELR